jgi:hypothetical protein
MTRPKLQQTANIRQHSTTFGNININFTNYIVQRKDRHS